MMFTLPICIAQPLHCNSCFKTQRHRRRRSTTSSPLTVADCTDLSPSSSSHMVPGECEFLRGVNDWPSEPRTVHANSTRLFVTVVRNKSTRVWQVPNNSVCDVWWDVCCQSRRVCLCRGVFDVCWSLTLKPCITIFAIIGFVLAHFAPHKHTHTQSSSRSTRRCWTSALSNDSQIINDIQYVC